MLARRWGNWNPHTLLPRAENDAAVVETVWRSLSKLNIDSPYDPSNAAPHMYPKNQEQVSRRNLHDNVRAAQFTTAKRCKPPKCPSTETKKRNVVYPYDRILFGHKQEQRTGACGQADAPCKHHAASKKPLTEGRPRAVDATCVKCARHANSWTQRANGRSPGVGGGGMGRFKFKKKKGFKGRAWSDQ